MSSVLVTDPDWAATIRTERERRHPNNRDEVWEGVTVMPPLPNNEHQKIVLDLCSAFCCAVNRGAGDNVLPGANVSDRDADWMNNYREPDAVVYLANNPAVDRNTHWIGGPDLAVEVASPGEDPRRKLAFYSKVNTREVLIVDRDPWALELYRLSGSQLHLIGRSDSADAAELASRVLPLTFQLRLSPPRPVIHMVHTGTGQTWTA